MVRIYDIYIYIYICILIYIYTIYIYIHTWKALYIYILICFWSNGLDHVSGSLRLLELLRLCVFFANKCRKKYSFATGRPTMLFRFDHAFWSLRVKTTIFVHKNWTLQFFPLMTRKFGALGFAARSLSILHGLMGVIRVFLKMWVPQTIQNSSIETYWNPWWRLGILLFLGHLHTHRIHVCYIW